MQTCREAAAYTKRGAVGNGHRGAHERVAKEHEGGVRQQRYAARNHRAGNRGAPGNIGAQ